MADIVDPAKRSVMMAGIGAKDTQPELVVRRALHGLGYRFRLHRKDLPGRPDIVLPRWNTAILVHGCFWHGHENCPLFRLPKSRTEFWAEKIGSNRLRDEKVRRNLVDLGWRVLEVWECATKGRSALSWTALLDELENAIKANQAGTLQIRGTQIA
ncbi:MAG: DNA mismatch endonuclease Vsr [Sphingomonadaceae bacterium]|nr:DNA mismatch endonuclease Vsr [Sphingomonadaceae bacterium]